MKRWICQKSLEKDMKVYPNLLDVWDFRQRGLVKK